MARTVGRLKAQGSRHKEGGRQMKKEKSLSELFEQARKAAPEIPVSKIRSLVESGKTSPLASKPSFRPRRITQLLNPLKLIVMITPIVIITAALLILNPGGENRRIASERIKPTEQPVVLNVDRPVIPIAAKEYPKQTFRISKQDSAKSGLVTTTQENLSQEPANAIRVSRDVMECMGINIGDTVIECKFRAIELWFTMKLFINKQVTITGSADEVHPIRNPSDTLMPTTESIILMGISNFGGMELIDMPTRVYRQTGVKVETWQDYLDLCIPLQVDIQWAKQNDRDIIFWIYPNERFFQCLPPDIARPMRMEFNYQKKRMDPNFVPNLGYSIGISGEQQRRQDYNMGVPIRIPEGAGQQDTSDGKTEPVPCVYFSNLCESLSGLDYVNLYPNPVQDKLNVDLVLQKAKQIRFRVLDLGGRLISDEDIPENYPAGGRYTHQLDVSKLQNGFYLMVMTDEEGAKVSRRFIKN
ncbi:MAG: T9SS type A sorting domain-containing protein [Bacteroidota bacterium]